MDFSIAPYYDDFQSTSGAKYNNYMRILFKPGYAVQARELTQIQSILQNQIKSLGDFVLQNGSPVSGGHITFDVSSKSIQIQSTQSGIPITISDFNNQLIINATGSAIARAKVTAVDTSTSSAVSAGSLILKYLTSDEFADGDVIQIANGNQEKATLLTSNALSNCATVSINDGVFYVDGYFVYVPSQTIVLSSLSSNVSCTVGLQINDAIVDYTADAALLDPAQASFNYQAPGADRYQFNLTLTYRPIGSTDTSAYFELLTIENGVVTSQVDYALLGGIQDTLAATVYDQSGDFTVRPFRVSASENTANQSTFLLNIEPGKAYVKGYEFETIGTVKIADLKAQTTERNSGYDLSLFYGNYVITNNVHSGNIADFNIQNFGSLDLHTVPQAYINTKSSAAYSNTKIGTAKIRDLEPSGDGVTYYAYLTAINTAPLVVNSSGFSPNQYYANVPLLTTQTGAFNNVTVSVVSGNSSGDVRTIIASTSDGNGNTSLQVNNPFTDQIDSTSVLSLNFGIKDVDSLVVSPTIVLDGTAANNYVYSNNYFAGMDISAKGKSAVGGNTNIFSTDYNSLIYPLPQTWIAQSTTALPSMNNMSYLTKKVLTGVTFATSNSYFATSGTQLKGTTSESYTFGFGSGGSVPDILANETVTILVTNKQSSNLTNGSIIVFNHNTVANGNSIYQNSQNSITAIVSSSGAFTADIILTIQENSVEVPQNNLLRTKTRVGNTANITLISTDSPANGGYAIIGAPGGTYFDSSNGYVWIPASSVVNVPGKPQSLYVPDVLSVIRIYDSGNPSYPPNSVNAIDVTNSYLLNGGQNDNYYDHGYLLLKEGYNPPRGQIVVMLTCYLHSTNPGFFSVDSYPAFDYNEEYIPHYSSKQNGVFSLRDAIDFRPTRAPGYSSNVQPFTLITGTNGVYLPNPNYAMPLSYSYYVPRIDKLTLTKDRQFNIIYGTPGLNPQTPADADDAMTLYIITVPQYTSNTAAIGLKYIDHRGYTMKDIGTLDKRITNLESYTTLNSLQQKATNQTITYQNGTTAKDIYGVITDNFADFSVADTTSVDLLSKIQNSTLTPIQEITPINFNFLSSTSGNYQIHHKTLTVGYTETPAITQNTVTRGIVVQPFSFGQFKGQMKLKPESDFFVSQNLVPVVITAPDEPVIQPAYTVGANGVAVPVATSPVTPVIVINPLLLPIANITEVPTLFTQTLTSSGGTSPYVYTVITGSLPPGLSLGSSTGIITGYPTYPGRYHFSIKSTDVNGLTSAQDFYMTVNMVYPTILVSPLSVSGATSNVAYSTVNFTASGAYTPYTYSVTSGSLPTGLSLSSGGALTGTPTSQGNYNFTVTAKDVNSYNGSSSYTMTVSPPTISITPSTLPSGIGSTVYTTTAITASGGNAPYTYTVYTGSLPPGLTLSSGGSLSGTPTSNGTYNFHVKATDSNSAIGIIAYTVAVAAPTISISPSSLLVGTAEAAYSGAANTVSASGGSGVYTYAVTNGSLPSGLSMASTGIISGTPTVAGTFGITVTATDANGFIGSKVYSVLINAPTITLSP